MSSEILSASSTSVIDNIIFRVVRPISVTSDLQIPELASEAISIIDRVVRFRGEVIYENGLRPSFCLTDGSYADYCVFDRSSYHVLAYFNDRLVGCVRLYLLSSGKSSYCEYFIGRQKIAKISNDLGVSYHELSEVSRWVVQPEFRGKNLGTLLMAGIIFLAHQLGQKIVLAMSGTVMKQDRALIRMGFQPVQDIPLYPEATVMDNLRLIYLDLRSLEKISLAAKVTKMSYILDLNPSHFGA